MKVASRERETTHRGPDLLLLIIASFRSLRSPAMAPLSSTQACRKYLDLINGISAKYVNWNPLRRIEVS